MNKNEEMQKLICVLKNHESKLRDEIHNEAVDTFGKNFYDLNPDEVSKLSIRCIREYKRTKDRLFWCMAKYTCCTVIETDGSINGLYNKYKDFKEEYYKKRNS